MGIPRIVARNVFANWTGMAVEVAAGFVVAPYLVRGLGQNTYGIWVLIGSLTGYFGLLDLGVRGSAGRHIAFYRAKNDTQGVNAIFNTALAFLAGAALVALLGTFAVRVFFPHLFPEIPPDQLGPVDLALAIVGWNLALTLLLNIFDATLWAFQRFDLLNAIDIPFVILRAALIFTFVASGDDLIILAMITLGITTGRGLAKMVVSFMVDPSLRLRRTAITRDAFRQLCGYGVWHFLLSLSRLAIGQVGPVLVGNRLGIALVAPYAIAARLISYASSILISATGVLTPLAASFHAEEDQDRQRTLFLEGGKYCTALAFYFLTLFLCLGKPFLRLWMGPSFEGAYPLLVTLAAGEALPMTQWVTQSLILGMGRHSWLAMLGLGELAVAIPLGIVLMNGHGLPGLCVAFVLPGVLGRGLVPMFFGCRLVHVSWWTYGRRTLAPALLTGGPAGLALGLLIAWQAPATWFQLMAYTVAHGVCFLGLGCLFVLGLIRGNGCRWSTRRASIDDPVPLLPVRDRAGAMETLPPPH